MIQHEQRISVAEEFKNVFSHFYFTSNFTEKSIKKTLLPTFQMMMVFSFGTEVLLESDQNSQIQIDKCVVLGPVKQAITYVLPVGAEILVANFKDDAFYRFFGQAVLYNFSLHPDELLKEDCFSSLWQDLKGINSTEKRVEFILEFCRPYLKIKDQTFSEIENLDTNSSLNLIKVLAKKNNQSERNIQLKFKKNFGFTAKEMARYQRFLKTFEFLQNQISEFKIIDWMQIVEQFGFYDQSQLIHDFQHYLNLSPTQFLKFQQEICFAKLP